MNRVGFNIMASHSGSEGNATDMLQRFVEDDIISPTLREKMKECGLTYDVILKTFKEQGHDGVKSTFKEKFSFQKKALHKLLLWLNKNVDSKDMKHFYYLNNLLKQNFDTKILSEMKDADISYEDLIDQYENHGEDGVKKLLKGNNTRQKKIKIDSDNLEILIEWLQSCPEIIDPLQTLVNDNAMSKYICKKTIEKGLTYSMLLKTFKDLGQDGLKRKLKDKVSRQNRVSDKIIKWFTENANSQGTNHFDYLNELSDEGLSESAVSKIKDAGIAYKDLIDAYENDGKKGIEKILAGNNKKEMKIDMESVDLQLLLDWLKTCPEIKESLQVLKDNGVVSRYMYDKILNAGLTYGMLLKSYEQSDLKGLEKMIEGTVPKNSKGFRNLLEWFQENNQRNESD